MTVRSAPLLLALLVSLTGCPRKYAVGDHVLVEWEGQNYPAMIKEAPSSSKFKVHYDGYDDVWDQEVTRDKIKDWQIWLYWTSPFTYSVTSIAVL